MSMNNFKKAEQISYVDPDFQQSQEELIKLEGQKTRRTIWLAAFVAVALVVIFPFIITIAPVLVVILVLSVIGATIGILAAKLLNRRRSRRIYKEIEERESGVVDIDLHR